MSYYRHPPFTHLTNSLHREVVVAFRGSQAIADWIKNLEATKVMCPFNNICGKVHRGFWLYYTAVRDELFIELGRAIKILRSIFWWWRVHKLTFTGHSLGGALAILAATDLQFLLDRINQIPIQPELYLFEGIHIRVRTFGSPRVGDALFASLYDLAILDSRRYVNLVPNTVNVTDIVPTLPPELFGFTHVHDLDLLPCSLSDRFLCHSIINAYLPHFDPFLNQTMQYIRSQSSNPC